VIIPVPWQYLNEVDTTHTFAIEPVFNGHELEGTIIKKSGFMQLVSGQQVFVITGVIDIPSGEYPVNMLVQCSIHGIKRTVWDYLSYFLQALI
jgi:hypothetical protein